MSSAAYLTMEDEGVTLAEWMEFCKERGIVYLPQTVGGNVFSLGAGTDEVEIIFGTMNDASSKQPPAEASEITFSTYFGGNTVGVAASAAAAWERFGGKLSAAPEVKGWLTRPFMAPQGYPRQDAPGPRTWEAGYQPPPGTTHFGPFTTSGGGDPVKAEPPIEPMKRFKPLGWSTI